MSNLYHSKGRIIHVGNIQTTVYGYKGIYAKTTNIHSKDLTVYFQLLLHLQVLKLIDYW